MSNSEDVILWKVPIKSTVHVVEFEHGERTGVRVLRVNGNELFRTGQYKITGKASFQVETLQCRVMVKAADPTLLMYALKVDGKLLKDYKKEHHRRWQSWDCNIDGVEWKIDLDKSTMDIRANGIIVPTTGEFLDDETVTSFTVGVKATPCKIVAIGSGNIEIGIIHKLYVNNVRVPINRDYFDD
ncbi:hypothetical protein CRE_19979 [Caenorhabditis remanei]|uniref:Uncharacterized protein n=1 Tax=Caenorhabditis remanei TaxID=31234 RepID=E3N8H2_CAERE|nr:hypothetical protein CRE_19979 [Caenorhabditis remanei]